MLRGFINGGELADAVRMNMRSEPVMHIEHVEDLLRKVEGCTKLDLVHFDKVTRFDLHLTDGSPDEDIMKVYARRYVAGVGFDRLALQTDHVPDDGRELRAGAFAYDKAAKAAGCLGFKFRTRKQFGHSILWHVRTMVLFDYSATVNRKIPDILSEYYACVYGLRAASSIHRIHRCSLPEEVALGWSRKRFLEYAINANETAGRLVDGNEDKVFPRALKAHGHAKEAFGL